MPANAFKVVQMQTARSVAGTLESPGFLSELALDKGLYPPTDPELRHSTPQSVSSLTLSDAQNYYAHVFRPYLTSIVVVGKISPDEAKAEVEKYFGDWSATGPKPQT